jgi:hypothetical protein
MIPESPFDYISECATHFRECATVEPWQSIFRPAAREGRAASFARKGMHVIFSNVLGRVPTIFESVDLHRSIIYFRTGVSFMFTTVPL